MYSWDYIEEAALAKLDLDQDSGVEANKIGYIDRFLIYANEAMTQICNAIKPKRTSVEITVYDANDADKPEGAYVTYMDISLNNVIKAAKDGVSDFIAFSDSPSYEVITCRGQKHLKEVHDNELLYHGYNNVMFLKPGTYLISYKARWVYFTVDMTNDDKRGEPIDAPDDVLDCIPSYIASQCYKVDDEYKAQVYRNEYEMFLARVDDTDFDNTTTLEIGGDW